MKFYISIAILLAALTNSYSQSKMNQEKTDYFQKYFSNQLRESGIVGGAFVFSKNGERLISLTHGFAHLEKDLPVDEETIFHWASNTKTFTGIAIMQLRDRGLLSLDDKVTKYLPELSEVRNPYGSMDDVTIRHLMTHSSGFRNPTYPYKRGFSWEPFEPTQYSQLEATFPFTELLFKPGEKFGYSNPGILFLGRIIEKLSGDDYEVYVDKNIFKPLGMHLSYFDRTPFHLLDRRSHSYYLENGKLREGIFDADTGITVSNGGLNSPVKDMVRYFDFLLGENLEGEKVLSRNTLLEMFEPAIKSDSDANGYRGMTTDVGLTFFMDRVAGESYIGHGGDQNGFISYTEFNLRRKTFSIIVMNTKIVSGEIKEGPQDVVMRLRQETRKLHESF